MLEVQRRTEIRHGESYYSRVLRGDYRMAPRELQAACEWLSIDPVWAFEEMGWPQAMSTAGEGAEDPVLPEVIQHLSGITADEQIQLIQLLPLLPQLRAALLSGRASTVTVGETPKGRQIILDATPPSSDNQADWAERLKREEHESQE